MPDKSEPLPGAWGLQRQGHTHEEGTKQRQEPLGHKQKLEEAGRTVPWELWRLHPCL